MVLVSREWTVEKLAFEILCVENAVHPTNPLLHKASSQLPFLLLYFFLLANLKLFEENYMQKNQNVFFIFVGISFASAYTNLY